MSPSRQIASKNEITNKEVISVKTISQLLAIVFLSVTVLTGASLPTDPVEKEAKVKTFTVDYLHSNVGFKVRHLGISNVNGNFNEYEAKVMVDPADLSTLQAEATFQIGSIDTGNERRDGHLKSDDFFNAEKYPTMTFKSTKVMVGKDGEFMLHGNLTIRDVTKEVVLEGELLGTGQGQNGMKVGFEAETTINRFDYNLKWDKLTEAGGLVVGDNVRIILELELDEMS